MLVFGKAELSLVERLLSNGIQGVTEFFYRSVLRLRGFGFGFRIHSKRESRSAGGSRWYIDVKSLSGFRISRELRELAGADMVFEVRSGKAFQEFIREQLEGVQGVRFRKMFGGFGIYAEEVFFGIIHGEHLYLRTNETTRVRYVDAGMSWFVTPGGKKSIKAYYEVPAAVIEQAKELKAWAREAISAAQG